MPLLTTIAPKFVESSLEIVNGAGTEMNLGAFAAIYPLLSLVYLLGLLLFGIATFRAGILSRGGAVLLAISGPLAAITVAPLPHQFARFAAIPMGITLIWLGYALWSERRASAVERLPDITSAQLHQSGIS